MGGHIFGDNAPCSDNRSVANPDAADYDGVGANPNIIAYDRVFRLSACRRYRVLAANYYAVEQGNIRTDVDVLVHHNSPAVDEKQPGPGAKRRGQVHSRLSPRPAVQDPRCELQGRKLAPAPLAKSKREDRPKRTVNYRKRKDRANRKHFAGGTKGVGPDVVPK
jgi:hypothetical protein